MDLYYLKEDININNVKIQEEEVDQVKWASIDEINEMIRNKEFSESHTEFFKCCLEFLNKK